MKIRLIYIGKLSELLRDPVEHYLRRLKHYCDIETVSIKQSKGSDAKKIIKEEGARIIKTLGEAGCLVALGEEGNMLRSVEFANWLSVARSYSSTITFVIGGAYGLCESVKSRADMVMSLSRMTLQHDLAQLLFLEQLYRAMTIIRGESYHK